MRINIIALGFKLTSALRTHIERRLIFALGRTATQVGRLSVRLSRGNGAKGGNDKRCQLQITLANAPQVNIDDSDKDLYSAIDRAAGRASRSVARQLERTRDHRHGPQLPRLSEGLIVQPTA